MLGMSAWGSRRKGPMFSQIPGKFYETGTLGPPQPLIKSWSWRKIIQWLSRNPPGNHSTYVPTISHIFSRQTHHQNPLHPSTCSNALLKPDKKNNKNVSWLGGTWSCSGKIHKPQMFRDEKHRYKSTSRDTEVTVGSKSNICKRTHPELYSHTCILSWRNGWKDLF